MSRPHSKRILIGLTSHGDLAGLRPAGYYLAEVAHPWRVFTDAGYTDLVGQNPASATGVAESVLRSLSTAGDR